MHILRVHLLIATLALCVAGTSAGGEDTHGDGIRRDV